MSSSPEHSTRVRFTIRGFMIAVVALAFALVAILQLSVFAGLAALLTIAGACLAARPEPTMRIDQPEHLKEQFAESWRRDARIPKEWWKWVVALFALVSAIPLVPMLIITLIEGKRRNPLPLIAAACLGPIFFAFLKVMIWLGGKGKRYAELRGRCVCIGELGGSFRLSHLRSCKIEPDRHFPEIHQLRFVFGSKRSSSIHWSMMVDDLDEAERFRDEITRLAKLRVS